MKSPLPSPEAEIPDAQFVAAVQRGDVHAFDPLVARHLDAVHAFVAFKLPVAHLVDEITHETFVFAFHRIHEFAPGTGFRAWLKAIAGNKIRAEVERYRREEANRLAYSERCLLEEASPGTGAGESAEVEALQECLQAVPDPLQRLLQLKYREEQSSEEMARSLRRSVAWIRTNLCRVRQQLRECLDRKLRAQPAAP